MGNKLYLVAGSRNILLAESTKSGLWANVGMTHGRSPEERLRDPDYRKKQIGGELLVLSHWDIGKHTDHEIHPDLKHHEEVKYEHSDNTEEFLFLTDSGDGARAQQIIEEIILKRCIPIFVRQRLESQADAITQLSKQIEEERKFRLKIETLEPWQIMQEQLLETEKSLKITSQEKIDKIGKKYASVLADLSDQIRSLTDYNKDLESECVRLKDSNILLTKQIELSDFNRIKHIRYSLLITLFAITLAAGIGFNLIGSYYDIRMNDWMITISELKRELKETKRDHAFKKSRIEFLEKKIEQIDTQKEQANKQHNQKLRKECMMASSCSYDRVGDNYITCSVYKGTDRFQCTYTVEGRVEMKGYCDESIKIYLSDGKVKYNDCSGYWKSYKIVKYEDG